MSDEFIEEVQNWRAEKDLLLWKEAIDVEPLYKYMVILGEGGTYLCNSVTESDKGERTVLRLEDVWVHDALMGKRIVPSIVAVVSRYEIVLLRGDAE